MARGGTLARWSAAEDEAIREAYPLHGADWDGWADALPGRSESAIRSRAGKLGLRLLPEVLSLSHSQANRRRKGRRKDGEPRPDPLERSCMELLAGGMPPSAIDARLGLEPGTSRRVISQRWRRTRKEGSDGNQ